MTYAKTATLEKTTNKGQRAVIVGVLAKATTPLTPEQITERAVKTGQYHGKATKGHVNKWAMEKAGGNLGSIKYHLRALVAEGRVKELNEAKPKREKKAKEGAPEAPAAPAVETPAAEPEVAA